MIREVRKLINDNMPDGYKEVMRWGMITWEVPLSYYPHTYNGQPLSYVALASQKNKISLYLMGCYGDDAERKRFESAYRASGKKLDFGKSCVRFKSVDDLPLSVIASSIRKFNIARFIKIYESVKTPDAMKITPYRETYPNGTIKAIGQYKGKDLHGKWKWYRKSGVIMRSGEFKNGVRVGTWTTYDLDGRIYKVTKI